MKTLLAASLSLAAMGAVSVQAQEAVSTTPHPVPAMRTEQRPADDAVSTRVRSALVDPRNGINGIVVDVSTQNGRVSLQGLVAEPGDVQRATEIASNIPGVQSVRNHLGVRNY